MTATATAVARPPALRWTWEARDRHLTITLFAVFGVAAAAAMALLGLPPVDLHGPLHQRFGIMDPLCGGTRAARYTLRGEWGQAWRYNPLGLVAVIAAVAVVARALVGLVGRRWLTVTVVLTPRWRRLIALAVVVGFAALEVRQQLIAPLLMATA